MRVSRKRAERALERQLAYQTNKADAIRRAGAELERELTSYAQEVKRRIEVHRTLDAATRVLEVGSGAHGVVFFLDLPHAVGVDPLADEYSRLFPQWQSRVKTLAAFGESLPFEDCSFDVVISDNVVDHAENPGKIVRELARVLAPGGILYFTVNVHHRVYALASGVHDIATRLGLPLEIAAFADHTVHLTLKDARALFRHVDLRMLHEEADVASARAEARRASPRHAGDLLKRLFFKNARFEVIATRE